MSNTPPIGFDENAAYGEIAARERARLTQLEADNARLRKAAEQIQNRCDDLWEGCLEAARDANTSGEISDEMRYMRLSHTFNGIAEIAREALSSTPAPGVVAVPVELLEQFLDEIGSEHGDDQSDANCRACNLHDQLRALHRSPEGHQSVSDAERELLLTVARVLRAQLKEIGSSWADEDVRQLNEASKPWESNVVAIQPNEEAP